MSGMDGLQPEFAMRLGSFLAASGGRVWLNSGYRSVERQQQLWDAALAKYGDPEVADNWVARPGRSNHNHGIAGDLGFADAAAREWAHANAGRFGLHFPMGWEPWHIEPVGSEQMADRGAYTTPPPGEGHPADVAAQGEDPHDPAVQMKRLMGVMAMPAEGPQAPASQMEAPSMPGGVTEPEAQAAALIEEPAV